MTTNTQNQNQKVTGPATSFLDRFGQFSWGTYIVVGILAIILGIVAFVWTPETAVAATILFVVFLFVSGIFQIVSVFDSNISGGYRVLAFISGALSIILGIMAWKFSTDGSIYDESFALMLLPIFIGISWVFRSIAGLSTLASAPKFDGKGWLYALNILWLVAGVLIFVFPEDSIEPLVWLFGAVAIIMGIVEIYVGFKIKSLKDKAYDAAGQIDSRIAGQY